MHGCALLVAARATWLRPYFERFGGRGESARSTGRTGRRRAHTDPTCMTCGGPDGIGEATLNGGCWRTGSETAGGSSRRW